MKQTNISAICGFTKKNTTIILDMNKIFGFASYEPTFIKLKISDILIHPYKNYLITHLYINGLRLDEYINNNIEYASSDAYHQIFTLYINEFDINYKFDFNIEVNITSKRINNANITYNILCCHNDNANLVENYKNFGVDNKSKNSAFMLLRTNPKLTGNIKLVVTDECLYLDTFKNNTHNILSKKDYRKLQVCTLGNYAFDIYNVFKDVSPNILMGFDDILYHTSYPLSSIGDEIDTQYEYGAETNQDSLYSENFKILAPLHLGNNLPDYFIIIKKEISNTNINYSYSTDYFKSDMLINGSQICKIFDLRRHTNIGTYLNNWNDTVIDYGLNNICYTDFDLTNTTIYYNAIKTFADTWNGISYKTGVLTSKEYTKNLNINKQSQEEINLYYLDGFKNNGLLYHGILNLEFMFNDPDASDFKAYQYFGVYVTENQLKEVVNIIKPELSSNNDLILYFDDNTNTTNTDEHIKIIDNVIASNNLLGISSGNTIKVFQNNNETPVYKNVLSYYKDEIAETPGTLLANVDCKKVELTEFKSFITLSFEKTINFGEHFRFIKENTKENKIIVFEIIASNDIRLSRFKQNYISPYVLTNQFLNEDGKIIEFYTLTFYYNSLSTSYITIKDLLERIEACIKKFDTTLVVLSKNDNTISICSLEPNIVFQHILPNNYDEPFDYVHYFNDVYNTTTNDVHNGKIVSINNDKIITSLFNNPIYDTNEIRKSSIIQFINVNLLNSYNVYEIESDLKEILNTIRIPLYYTYKKQYLPLQGINIKNNIDLIQAEFTDKITDNSTYILRSPYDVNKSIIYFNTPPMLTGNKIKIYDLVHTNISLLSLISIKDLNMKLLLENPKFINDNIIRFNETTYINEFTYLTKLKPFVLYELLNGEISDNDNKLNINIGQTFILLNDSYIVYNSINNKINLYSIIGYLNIKEYTEIKILDYTANLNIPILGNGIMEMKKLYNANNKRLITPICPNTNITWETTGDYYDHDNSVDNKFMFNYIQENIKGSFIEAGTEIPFTTDNIEYIDENNNLITTTISEYFKKTGHIKKFYKDVPMAIGYYDNNVLNFIYNGVQFELETNNTSLSNTHLYLENYNNYEIAIINEYNMQLPNEMYISEIENFILIINHQYKGESSKLSCNNIKTISNNTCKSADYYWNNAPYQYEMNNIVYSKGSTILHKTADYNINDKSAMSFILPGYTIYDHISAYDEVGFYTYFDINLGLLKHYNNSYFDTVTSTMYMPDFFSLNEKNPEYVTKETYKETFYEYFLHSQCYDGKNIQTAFIENLNDGIPEYDIIHRRDNRLYTPIILYYMKNIQNSDYNNLIEWTLTFLNNPISTYVINENGYEKIDINKNDILDFMIIKGPSNNSKYCQSYIKPEFINIFEFDNNYDIEKNIQTDCTLTNLILTNIKSIIGYPVRTSSNNQKLNYKLINKNIIIPTTLNKTYNNVNKSKVVIQLDLIKYNNTKLLNELNFNTSTDLQNVNFKLNYNYGISNLKSFFGSLCINIPNMPLIINDYSDNMINDIVIKKSTIKKSIIGSSLTNSLAANTFNIKINLNSLLINYFNKNNNFMSNWGTLSSKTINNFINNFIIPFYDLEHAEIIIYERLATTNKTKCTVDKSAYGNLSKNYINVNNLNIKLVKDKAKNIIATFNISAITNIAIYPIITFKRR